MREPGESCVPLDSRRLALSSYEQLRMPRRYGLWWGLAKGKPSSCLAGCDCALAALGIPGDVLNRPRDALGLGAGRWPPLCRPRPSATRRPRGCFDAALLALPFLEAELGLGLIELALDLLANTFLRMNGLDRVEALARFSCGCGRAVLPPLGAIVVVAVPPGAVGLGLDGAPHETTAFTRLTAALTGPISSSVT